MDLTSTTSTTKKVRTKVPAPEKEAAATKAVRSRRKSTRTADPVPEGGQAVSSEQLATMIATAAYYNAEERNFAPGNELDDWLAAERQVLGTL